jgi:hypothetical protein
MTRLKFFDLGDGARAAVVPDVDDCTSRYVVERPGEPTSIHRTTSPPVPPRIAFRVVRACPGCEGQLVFTHYENGSTTIEPFEEEEQT